MKYDFVVYRATPAGIMAAVSASRLGMKSLIVEPTQYLGGAMTSGLNATDTIDRTAITGISREFFLRVSEHYKTPDLAVRVESKVAYKIFMDMIRAAGVELAQQVDIIGIIRDESGLKSAQLSDDRVVNSTWWVDASYEGDLLAKAGISFSVGRDARSDYDEAWAGVQPNKSFLPWGGSTKIAPKVNGKYIPYVYPHNNTSVGDADDNVQSYCIRVTLTNNPKNRLPILPPEDFDFSQFDLFRKLVSKTGTHGVRSVWHDGLGLTLKSGYFNLAEIHNGKFDMNSGPLAPLNNPWLTDGWIDATLKRREQMTEEFVRYTKAILHFMQKDDFVPKASKAFLSDFGLPKDEYLSTENFPPQVYVREGRRLRGEKVFTQNHVESGGGDPKDFICRAQYSLDCKPVRWNANHDCTNVVREGMFFSKRAYKYGIPSWIILPKREEATNFFSVCAISASHVAFGSIRMEPTWMELGSVAAIMAKISTMHGIIPHDVSALAVQKLRDQTFDGKFLVPDVMG